MSMTGSRCAGLDGWKTYRMRREALPASKPAPDSQGNKVSKAIAMMAFFLGINQQQASAFPEFAPRESDHRAT
jgi:hypothetical protein